MYLLFSKHLAKVLLILALHSMTPDDPTTQTIPLMLAGQFDAASTYRVDALHPTLFHEDNPLLRPFQRNGTIFPAMAVADSIVLNLTNHYGKRHKVLGYAVVYSFVALHLWCADHNLCLARNVR